MTRYQFFGIVIYYIFWLLYKTLRIKVILPNNLLPEKAYVCAFWHGHQIYPALTLIQFHTRKQAALVSPSKDGDIVSAFLEKLGYRIVRGSSRRDAIKGSLQIVKALKDGYSFGFAIDGPLGPRHKVKSGASHMAQKLGLEIVPVGSACSNKWIFTKAWDKFELPKPFSKVVVYVDEPMEAPIDQDIKEINEALENRIHTAERKALECLMQNNN